MKKCSYCGRESHPDAAHCVECGTEFSAPPTPKVQVPAQIQLSPHEQRFWDQLTLRQLGILMVKLQAVWVLFPVISELTYLQGYFGTLFLRRDFFLLPSETKEMFCWGLFRIVIRVAAGLGAFIYADRLLSWLAKSLMANPNSTEALESKAAQPGS